MKDDSINQSSSDQNLEQEVWLSREEVLKRFQISVAGKLGPQFFVARHAQDAPRERDKER